jgi:putative ABC transport system permease protein
MTQDLRFAIRAFLRTPRFTIPAVLAIALGIGATTAVFSVVRGVVLKPLPYRDPERIVAIWESRPDRNRPRNVIADANFQAWRERQRSFEFLGMVGQTRQNVVLNDQPEEIAGFRASADALAALGAQPRLGRLYTPAEDLEGSDRVVIISHEFWQSRLGGRADVLGTVLSTDGRPRMVVGVMAPNFTIEGLESNYLIPYGWTIDRLRRAPGRGYSHGLARLKDGVSFDQAYDEMRRLMAQLEKEAPQRNANWSITLVPVHDQTVDQIRPALYVLAGAVLLVLLIACVNVANLLLARSSARQRELGVRTALGASRPRLIRLMLTESVLLASVGGLAGLLLAVVFHRGLLALAAERIPVPRLDQVALDLPVLLLSVGLSVTTGLVFGVVPAVFATSAANDALRAGGRHGGRPVVRRTLAMLVVAEVALSLVLLAGAGLLLRSFASLQQVDPGIRTSGLLTARVTLSGTRYDTPRARHGFYDEVLARMAAVPGVETTAGVSFLPMTGPGIGTSIHRTDRPAPPPGELPAADIKPVTPGFFRTMGVPHLAGRDFVGSDTFDSSPVAIVNETLRRQLFPNEDPVGKRLQIAIGGSPRPDGAEIVGVVGDIRMTALDEDIGPAVYLPHAQLPIGVMTFVTRTSLDPASLVPSLRAAVRAVDPALPVADVATMDEVVDATLSRPRAVSALLTVFAAFALALAGLGVYGVMAYSVSQRTQEIAVRMALGATPGSVFRIMIAQALRLVGLGVAIGLAVASWLSRFVTTMLFETPRFDPWTFGTTVLLLTAVALVASYLPARRSIRVSPSQSLRG